MQQFCNNDYMAETNDEGVENSPSEDKFATVGSDAMETECDEEFDLDCQQYENILDLSDFSPDKYNVEDSIAYMYKMALLHTSYGNYANGKSPPLVNREQQQPNVVSYFKLLVTSKKKGHNFNYWLNKWETIEVRIILRPFFSFIENIFPPSPSDVVIVVAGTLVSTSVISFIPTLLVTTIGSVSGFMTLFFIGTQVDKKIIEKGRFKFLSTEALTKAEKWFSKYGYWIILGNRFLSGTRAVISFFAGLSELNFKKTFLLAFTSSFVWNLLIISLGVMFGNNVALVDSYLKTYSNIVLIVTIVLVVLLILKYFLQKGRKSKS